MFVALVRFPDVPAEQDEKFREWFAWSNEQLHESAGLKSRRLLHAEDGAYVALVEHESADTFAAMHTTGPVPEVQSRLKQIVNDAPQATRFEVIVDSSTGSCCGGHGGHRGEHAAEAHDDSQSSAGGCCHSGQQLSAADAGSDMST